MAELPQPFPDQLVDVQGQAVLDGGFPETPMTTRSRSAHRFSRNFLQTLARLHAREEINDLLRAIGHHGELDIDPRVRERPGSKPAV